MLWLVIKKKKQTTIHLDWEMTRIQVGCRFVVFCIIFIFFCKFPPDTQKIQMISEKSDMSVCCQLSVQKGCTFFLPDDGDKTNGHRPWVSLTCDWINNYKFCCIYGIDFMYQIRWYIFYTHTNNPHSSTLYTSCPATHAPYTPLSLQWRCLAGRWPIEHDQPRVCTCISHRCTFVEVVKAVSLWSHTGQGDGAV